MQDGIECDHRTHSLPSQHEFPVLAGALSRPHDGVVERLLNPLSVPRLAQISEHVEHGLDRSSDGSVPAECTQPEECTHRHAPRHECACAGKEKHRQSDHPEERPQQDRVCGEHTDRCDHYRLQEHEGDTAERDNGWTCRQGEEQTQTAEYDEHDGTGGHSKLQPSRGCGKPLHRSERDCRKTVPRSRLQQHEPGRRPDKKHYHETRHHPLQKPMQTHLNRTHCRIPCVDPELQANARRRTDIGGVPLQIPVQIPRSLVANTGNYTVPVEPQGHHSIVQCRVHEVGVHRPGDVSAPTRLVNCDGWYRHDRSMPANDPACGSGGNVLA